MAGLLTKDELGHFLAMLSDSGAHLRGHFLLSSGLHSSDYLQCALFLSNTSYASWAGEKLARAAEDLAPDLVVSPAMGGIVIGHETARQGGLPFVFTEREGGVMRLRRFPAPGKVRFIVVEDVFTTGKSTMEVVDVMCSIGAEWVGALSLVNRSGKEDLFPVPTMSLWETQFPVYAPESCPMCANGEKLLKPGSRFI
ncbi:orotate phosphoribosyltransferase [Thermanaerovibrio velox DSM 12556]|uniref:Orotate phosphoribosyltransferase n=1 Tax=Thermanaerovibrio velox DSM 12556 TaxID=926567 RepID=H0US17_9BACT|nr:orotate phosphoribosyltransferase [Thermanaerovibrio velox]EHM10106.1 orotate phosphoribosyltransferase [Thermanaerovibrio velox DSM 12556]